MLFIIIILLPLTNLVTCKNFNKHTHGCSPTRLRLGLRASPLIGNVLLLLQICILRYVLQPSVPYALLLSIIGVHLLLPTTTH